WHPASDPARPAQPPRWSARPAGPAARSRRTRTARTRPGRGPGRRRHPRGRAARSQGQSPEPGSRVRVGDERHVLSLPGPNGPPRPSARRGTRAEMMRKRLVGDLEDALDLLVGERPDLALPGPPAQVLTQPRAAED